MQSTIICMSRQGDRPAPSKPVPVWQLARLWRQLGASGPPLPPDLTAGELRAIVSDELRCLVQHAYKLGLQRSAILERQVNGTAAETLDADELVTSQHELILRAHSEAGSLRRTRLGVTPLLIERAGGFAVTAADLLLGLLLAKVEIEVTAGSGIGSTIVIAHLANGRRALISVRAAEPIIVDAPQRTARETVYRLDASTTRALGTKVSALIEAPLEDAFGLQVFKDLRRICADLPNLDGHPVLGLPPEEFLGAVLTLYPSLRMVEYHPIWGSEAAVHFRRRRPSA